MTSKPDKDQEWVDPYTKQRLLGPDAIAALKAQMQQDPHADLAPVAGACLVELYKEQFTVVPAISYRYEKPFGVFQSSFILTPAKKATGGMRAWNSMATALDQLNKHFQNSHEGNDLVLIAPPPSRDGKIHISISNTEEFVKLVHARRADIYDRAETNLRQGVNYQEGLISREE